MWQKCKPHRRSADRQAVRYLQVENRALRAKLPTRVIVTPQERRRLVRFAKHLKGALDELVSIVHPDTLRRWIREERKGRKKGTGFGGRRTDKEIERIIVRIAKETGWGYCRILGELKKLGIHSVSETTVKNVLKRHGYDPGPKRGVGTWDEFLKIHASTLWQADFISKRSLTRKGLRDLFVLVFLHVQTRRVYLSPATEHPNEAWVKAQAAAFVKYAKKEKLGAELLIHDRDTKFTASFDQALKTAGTKVIKTSYRSPNVNAFVERFIQTLGQECLDYFVVFGARHLNHLCSVFVDYYHQRRPHQGKDNELLVLRNRRKRRKSSKNSQPMVADGVRCETKLGGLLKHYYRRAA